MTEMLYITPQALSPADLMLLEARYREYQVRALPSLYLIHFDIYIYDIYDIYKYIYVYIHTLIAHLCARRCWRW